MPDKKWDPVEIASLIFCVSVGLLLLYWIGKYLLLALMPFLIAFGIAGLLRPAIRFLADKTKLSARFSGILLSVAVFLLPSAVLSLGINRLVGELSRFIARLSGKSEQIGMALSSLFSEVGSLSARIPILKDIVAVKGLEALGVQIDRILSDLIKEFITSLTTGIPAVIRNLVAATPSVFLFILVTVIATVYITLDLEKILAFLKQRLPPSWIGQLTHIKEIGKPFLLKYFRAYVLILFLTFCELFVGFSVLELDYAFLLAFLISFIDILPIFGVGTVLIPWSVIALIGKNWRAGFGLLVLWFAITVIRQIIEPRIVGGTFGLHPALTLFGIYIGFRLFGILGMLLAPAALVLIRFLWREYDKKHCFLNKSQ